MDNIGLIDIKFTPSLDPANLHNDTDTGFFFNFISSISAIDIGDSVFVMTAAKTLINIQFLNVTDPECTGWTSYENGDRNGNGESNTSANTVTVFTCRFLSLILCLIYDK